jgi:hypothetical protein
MTKQEVVHAGRLGESDDRLVKPFLGKESQRKGIRIELSSASSPLILRTVVAAW